MKPLVNRNTRFNFFDALIAVILLLSITALVLYLIPQKGTEKTATLTFTASDVRAECIPLLSVGDMIYDDGGTRMIGKVESVSDPVADTQHAGSFLLTFEISAAVSVHENGEITVKGLTFTKQDAISLRSASLALDCTCTSILVQGE